MIELNFEQFYQRQYRERGYLLYVMKNGYGDALYVGISLRNIWERWFGFGGHVLYDNGRFEGYSLIGQKLQDNFPDSLAWKIQLWTLKDCLRFCKADLPVSVHAPTIELVEAFMIRKLRPSLNVVYNVNPGKDSMPKSRKELEREKTLDALYKKLFD